jgi:hypothetical protein
MDSKREVAKLQRKVCKWLKEWIVMPIAIQNFRDKPPALFEAYLAGEEGSIHIGRKMQQIHFWHLVHYEHAVLNEGGTGHADLALAMRHAEAYIDFETAFAEVNKGGSVLQNNAVLYFSLSVIAGWKDAAARIGQALVRGLDTSLLDLRHTDRHCAGEIYRHFWFILHLYAQSGGSKFDISLYSYPPDMRPYAEALDDWLTTDLVKAHDCVCAMADFHVRQTRNTSHDNVEEFDAESVMLFPYEILCWLRLREWAGLENPKSFDHPLMQQPLSRLPAPVPLDVPATPLLDQVIARFRQEFPDSFSEWVPTR